MSGRAFTCDACRGTFLFDPDWTDEDADKEERERFGFNSSAFTRAIVCGDCYSAMMGAIDALEPAAQAALAARAKAEEPS